MSLSEQMRRAERVARTVIERCRSFVAVSLKRWEEVKGAVDVPEPHVEDGFAVWRDMPIEELYKVYRRLVEAGVRPTFAKLPWAKPWVRTP